MTFSHDFFFPKFKNSMIFPRLEKLSPFFQVLFFICFDFLFRYFKLCFNVSLLDPCSLFSVLFFNPVSINFTDQNSPRNGTKTAKRPHSWLKSAIKPVLYTLGRPPVINDQFSQYFSVAVNDRFSCNKKAQVACLFSRL